MTNPKLTVVEVPTDDLVPYAGNAKEHPEWHIGQIATSITEFGFNDPIGVWHNEDGDTVIVEGHGRLLAAKELGMDTVPVVYLDHLDDEARRAYTLVHNQLTTNTGYDEEVLASELASIANFDMGSFGFDENTSLEDYDHVEEAPIPDEVLTRVKPGEVWVLGDHRLICGDSTDPETVKKLMNGEYADLLLTDPPYNVALGMNENGEAISKEEAKRLHKRTDGLVISNDKFKDEDEFVSFLQKAFAIAFENMKDGGSYYIWYGYTWTPAFFEAVGKAGADVRQVLQWVKNIFAFGRQDYQCQHESCLYGWKPGAAHYFVPIHNDTTVFDSEKPVEKMTKSELVELVNTIKESAEPDVLRFDKPMTSRLHPTMKPVALFAHLIRNSSRKGDAVLDVFAGSGTTVIACEQMNRRAYVAEYDPHYCDVIIARWEDLTGKKAEKED